MFTKQPFGNYSDKVKIKARKSGKKTQNADVQVASKVCFSLLLHNS